MPAPDALDMALALLRDPASVRRVRKGRLPAGVSFLLEVANGEPPALEAARRRTGYPDPSLEEAAAFFIEQILLDRRADSYRTLGGSASSPHAELRRNMALLMRWLHPDRKTQRNSVAVDREVFAARVSRAWEDLKSDTRRAAYDEKCAADARNAEQQAKGRPGSRPPHGTAKGGNAGSFRNTPFSGRRMMGGRMAASAPHAGAWHPVRGLRSMSIWQRILWFLRGRP